MTDVELQVLYKNLKEIERLLKYEDIYRAKKVLSSVKSVVRKKIKNK